MQVGKMFQQRCKIVEHIDRHHPDLPVAVITAYGNIEGAVQAMQRGAFDFVSKPVDLEVLRKLVTSALQRTPRRGTPPKSRLLGHSPAITGLRKLRPRL